MTIVGAGPAGIAAAIFLQRAGLDPLLLEMRIPGGLLRYADVVENYPGFPEGATGPQLAELFHGHLKKVGGSVTEATVTGISKGWEGDFVVASSGGERISRAVIVATGTRAVEVDVPGIQPTLGRRAFYDLFDLLAASKAGESIVVYGGGDAAFDQGLNLRRRGHPVTVLCRSRARCLPLLRERAGTNGVSVLEGRPLRGAEEGPEGIALELEGGMTIGADRLLIACGREPRLESLDRSLRTEVRFDRPPDAGVPGLYLAGDVVADGKRQVAVAVGSGVAAAMMAERYVREGTTQ